MYLEYNKLENEQHIFSGKYNKETFEQNALLGIVQLNSAIEQGSEVCLQIKDINGTTDLGTFDKIKVNNKIETGVQVLLFALPSLEAQAQAETGKEVFNGSVKTYSQSIVWQEAPKGEENDKEE